MEPLTVAHVSTQRAWHGGEEQARLLCEGLRSRHHRNLIFARRGGQFAQRMQSAGFEVCELAGSGRGMRAIWQMRQAWRRLRPDVVHFHDSHAISGGGLAAMGLGITARVAARRVDFLIRSTWRYRGCVDRVIAVSHAVAEACRVSGLADDRIRVVHDGVDPHRAQSGDRNRGRQSLRLADGDVLILTVATLTDHKGHTFLLQAVPQILQGLGAARCVVALAGDGELREPLEAEAGRLGVGHAVRFLGYRQDVPDLLKAADLFVLPSHMEGLCSTLIDVMFARTPIVATTAGGIPDVLARDGEPAVAVLVPPRDPPALAAAVIEAFGNRQRLAALVDAAEKRAHRSFTAHRMVEGTLAVYEELIGQDRAKYGQPRNS